MEKELVLRAPPPRRPTVVARRPPRAVAWQRACGAAEELVVRAPPPRPPALSIRLRPREVAPQPQDRPLLRPPRLRQLHVWRVCNMFSLFRAARTPRRVLL